MGSDSTKRSPGKVHATRAGRCTQTAHQLPGRSLRELPAGVTLLPVSPTVSSLSPRVSPLSPMMPLTGVSVQKRDGVEEQESAAAWVEERQESKFAKDLKQLEVWRKLSPNPSDWKCDFTDATENLWLNLSTGKIGSGRQQWDGSGGNGTRPLLSCSEPAPLGRAAGRAPAAGTRCCVMCMAGIIMISAGVDPPGAAPSGHDFFGINCVSGRLLRSSCCRIRCGAGSTLTGGGMQLSARHLCMKNALQAPAAANQGLAGMKRSHRLGHGPSGSQQRSPQR